MSNRLERRSGKERRKCTMPAILALGYERRWHRPRRRVPMNDEQDFYEWDAQDSQDARQERRTGIFEPD